jgi:hypothetical protein
MRALIRQQQRKRLKLSGVTWHQSIALNACISSPPTPPGAPGPFGVASIEDLALVHLAAPARGRAIYADKPIFVQNAT